MTCDFQQCGILTSVDSDEQVQPPFSLETQNDVKSVLNTHRIFKRLAKALIRLRVYCAYAQADLRLCWLHIPYCWKSHARAQLLSTI